MRTKLQVSKGEKRNIFYNFRLYVVEFVVVLRKKFSCQVNTIGYTSYITVRLSVNILSYACR